MKQRNRKMTLLALGCMAGALLGETKPESFFKSGIFAGNVVFAAEEELPSDPENSAGTKKLVYMVKDQVLESGKRLEDLEVPEYAVSAGGSPVYGKLVWMEPESGCALDGKMEICGAAGEEIRLGWIFSPDASFPGYEPVTGVAVIRLKPAEKGEQTTGGGWFPSFPDNPKDSEGSQEKKSESEEKDGPEEKTGPEESLTLKIEHLEASGSGGKNSVSGVTSGASTVTEILEGMDPLSMMGSLITGMGVLGNGEEQGPVLPDEKEESEPPIEKDPKEGTERFGSMPWEMEENENTVSESREKTGRKSGTEEPAEYEGNPAGDLAEHFSRDFVGQSSGNQPEAKSGNDFIMALAGYVKEFLEKLGETVPHLFALAVRGIFLVHRFF